MGGRKKETKKAWDEERKKWRKLEKKKKAWEEENKNES